LTKILGIDPGSIKTGYGIIESKGNHTKHIENGVIKVRGETLAAKLKIINIQITAIIKKFQPDEIAIEKVFMHRNADSALKLGQARGAAITACAMNNIPLFEYSANQVKKACVGNGHATKEQVHNKIFIICWPCSLVA
jgi:crossover junction endodeoxyribonuclease RuvC